MERLDIDPDLQNLLESVAGGIHEFQQNSSGMRREKIIDLEKVTKHHVPLNPAPNEVTSPIHVSVPAQKPPEAVETSDSRQLMLEFPQATIDDIFNAITDTARKMNTIYNALVKANIIKE